MKIDYEIQSAVAVSLKNDRILIEVRRSYNNPPFSFSLSLETARNLALVINAILRESGN